MSLLQHLYEGECPDNWTGPQARDIRCPACRALDAPLELLVEIDRPAGQQPVARIYRHGVLVFDGVSSALPEAGEPDDVRDVSARTQVAAVVVERTGRYVSASQSSTTPLASARSAVRRPEPVSDLDRAGAA